MYDLLIRQAVIFDGTGAAGFPADVAVAKGRFVAMASRLDGETARIVDARGLALAPGFIEHPLSFGPLITSSSRRARSSSARV